MYMCVVLGRKECVRKDLSELFGQPYIYVCACTKFSTIIYIYYVSAKFYMGKSARYDENIEES